MVFAKSDNVITYPVSNRTGVYSIQSRLTNEYNLTNSINQLKDTDSFVIDYVTNTSTDSNVDNSYIDFCIMGYYFRVKGIDTLKTSVSLPLFAYIKLEGNDIELKETESSPTKFKYYSRELSRLDEAKNDKGEALTDLDSEIKPESGSSYFEFTGLGFSKSKPSDSYFSLQLFDGEGNIPQSSLIKLRTDSTHRSVVIDDGDLDAQD